MHFSDLPALNACLNGAAAIFLVLGFVSIRRGRREAHRNCMIAACGMSVLFLIGYVTYHTLRRKYTGTAHTTFTDPAWFRPIYLTILVTHLLGAIAIVPLVLLTVWRAIRGQFKRHRRIARWTWPLWMYVSATGVLIYLLLYQIFQQH
jgi:uncharacterized membrane protein YozB (DUF420 family)